MRKVFIPQSWIKSLISSYPDYDKTIRLLTTIPGVKHDSAITIISEIGIDMSQFCNSKHLCCWADLTPGNNESADKKKSVRITSAGVYLKPALVHVLMQPWNLTSLLTTKRNMNPLLNAVARKELLLPLPVWFLHPSTGEVWNPSDLYKIDMPAPLVEKQKAKAIKQAKKLLQKKGLLPPDEPLASWSIY